MNSNQLRKQLADIDCEVDRVYADPTGRIEPIYDGVADTEKYLSSKYRILWVLKEPWDDRDVQGCKGGGWSIPEHVLSAPNLYEKIAKVPSYHPMIYTSWSVLNGFPKWEDMNRISQSPKMADILRQIACINVKKLPGFSQGANNAQILNWYKKAKQLLWKQIETLDPHVIIGCAPHMQQFMKDAGITEMESTGFVKSGLAQGRLFIETYHPGQRTILRQLYVDPLLGVIKNFVSTQA